ncbi:MAG TPA: hypothetical protein VG826_27430 [Pirellulales bacterium]|nr:hypothetical protein [Pirellulales bacterium]
MRKPWFRESDGWWYIEVVDEGGRRYERLSQDKNRAFDLWHERETTPEPDAPDVTLVTICDEFLVWCLEEKVPTATYDWHESYLRSFCRKWGALEVRHLKPWHVTKWLGKARFKKAVRKLEGGARRAAITSVKRALNWAVEEGYIQHNPIHKLKRPSVGHRETLIDGDLPRQMAAATDGPFRLFLLALRESGARPAEVRAVTADHVDLASEIWKGVPNKTGKKTGLRRDVYIGGQESCLNCVTRILMHFRPTGPLFLNSRGAPWTGNAVRTRMARLRGDRADRRARKGRPAWTEEDDALALSDRPVSEIARTLGRSYNAVALRRFALRRATPRRCPKRKTVKLPAGAVAYAFRHTYITDCLEKGIDPATVAALTGTSVAMIEKHYGHLTKRGEHLRAAARQVRSRSKS